MVGFRIGLAYPRWQGFFLFFVRVGVAEGLGEELAARVVGGEEYGGCVVY